MHSSKELASAMFAFSVEGQAAGFGDIFPDFDQRDRIGIVSRTPGGALGVSALIMAAITKFYDLERVRAEKFFRYPDYFLFHVGPSAGPYGMLDIWPDHKEIAIPAGDPEALLCAINDRAVTRLLVEDGTPGTPKFSRSTRGSIGLRDALAFAPDGRVRAADVTVTGNAVTESYVATTLKDMTSLTEEERTALHARRAALLHDGIPTETCRRLTIDEALALLA